MLPVPNPKVLFKSMSDGAVLFSTDNEVYFGLNSVGARVWELLPPVCATFDEICTRLASEYPEVSRSIIEARCEGAAVGSHCAQARRRPRGGAE